MGNYCFRVADPWGIIPGGDYCFRVADPWGIIPGGGELIRGGELIFQSCRGEKMSPKYRYFSQFLMDFGYFCLQIIKINSKDVFSSVKYVKTSTFFFHHHAFSRNSCIFSEKLKKPTTICPE